MCFLFKGTWVSHTHTQKCNHYPVPHCPSQMTYHEIVISGKAVILVPLSPILSQRGRSVSTSLHRAGRGQSTRPVCIVLPVSSGLSNAHHSFSKCCPRACFMLETTGDTAVNKKAEVSAQALGRRLDHQGNINKQGHYRLWWWPGKKNKEWN